MMALSKGAAIKKQLWDNEQQSHDIQKKLKRKLKTEGANMLKDIYESIQHIKDYINELQKATNKITKKNQQTKLSSSMPSENVLITPPSNTNNTTKIVLRENCKALNYFCQCIERVLLFGYKKKFFRSSSLWSFICDSTSKCFPLIMFTIIN